MDKEKLTVKERAFVEEHERKHKEMMEMREKRNQSNVATDYPINSALEKEHSVTIHWRRDGDWYGTVETYTFETEAEVKAFLLGVDEKRRNANDGYFTVLEDMEEARVLIKEIEEERERVRKWRNDRREEV